MMTKKKVEKRYDPQQAINYLNTLGNPVVEVRIFRKDRYLNGQYTGNIIAGYFNNQHFEKLSTDIQNYAIDPNTEAIYTTIQQLDPDTLFPHREPSENGTRFQRPYIRQPRDGFLSVSYRCRPTQDQGNIIDK